MSSYPVGITQCPKCGKIMSTEIHLKNGGQVVTCIHCHRNFCAETKNGFFTGKSR